MIDVGRQKQRRRDHQRRKDPVDWNDPLEPVPYELRSSTGAAERFRTLHVHDQAADNEEYIHAGAPKKPGWRQSCCRFMLCMTDQNCGGGEEPQTLYIIESHAQLFPENAKTKSHNPIESANSIALHIVDDGRLRG